jgi:Glycosyltransferase
MNQLRAGVASRLGDTTGTGPNVVWVHNSPKNIRMFLWDLLAAMPSQITIRDVVVPLRPRASALIDAVRRIRHETHSADLVHAQFGSLVGFLSAFTTPPLVLSLRGTDFYVLPSKTLSGWLEARLRRFFTYVACLRSSVIIVMSHRLKRDVMKWPFLSKKLIVTIVDPIGSEFVEGRSESTDQSLFNAAPFRVFVGSIETNNPVKRTWLIEKAVELCVAIGLPVEIKVVSGVPRDQVKLAMQDSDLIALASTHEGWPNIIKEARAVGLPFISTDVSDLASYSGPNTPNRIVDPHQLDIALGIVDAMARREYRIQEAEILGKVVGIKHFLVYAYLTGLK